MAVAERRARSALERTKPVAEPGVAVTVGMGSDISAKAASSSRLCASARPEHPNHADAIEWTNDYDADTIDEQPIKYVHVRTANRRNAAKNPTRKEDHRNLITCGPVRPDGQTGPDRMVTKTTGAGTLFVAIAGRRRKSAIFCLESTEKPAGDLAPDLGRVTGLP